MIDRDRARRTALALAAEQLAAHLDAVAREKFHGPIVLEVHCQDGFPRKVTSWRVRDRQTEKVV